jgi:hypothetical protein
MTEDQRPTPIVKLRSQIHPRGTVWLLEVRCPYCGKVHTHGGGTSRLRVASYLGPRVSHCSSVDQNGTRNYWLIDPDGLLA